MTDVFFLRPTNPEAQRMKMRLMGAPGVRLQMVDSSEAVNLLNPSDGSVFIFHLTTRADFKLTITQIAALSRKANGTCLNIVICEPKEATLRTAIESLPNTVYLHGDRLAHEIDLVVLKHIKKHFNDVNKTVKTETLTYTSQPASFIMKDQVSQTSITSETTIKEAQSAGASLFKPVADNEQKMLLITDAVDSQAPVVISNFGAKDEVKGYLFALDPKQNKILCQVSGASAEVTAFRDQSTVSKKIAMSISLQQSRVFFVSSNFNWIKDATFEVSMPALVYFVQRRKDFRLMCHPQSHQKIVIYDDKYEGIFGIYDLSQGGVSLLSASQADVERLASLSPKHKAALLIDGQTLEIGQLALRQNLPFVGQDATPLIKMGFSFETISETLKRRVGAYVDRKGRSYFMDYVVESEKKAAATKSGN